MNKWGAGPAQQKETLSDRLAYFSLPGVRRRLEEFRIEYEKLHGLTDLTARYTSQWSAADQQWLGEHHPDRYFDGLPPFVQAFLRQMTKEAALEGNLDGMPDKCIELFLRGKFGRGGGPQR